MPGASGRQGTARRPLGSLHALPRAACGYAAHDTTSQQQQYMDEDADLDEHGHVYRDPALKRALEDSKMEAVAAEYNHLLASQLDSQRQYFEVSRSAS